MAKPLLTPKDLADAIGVSESSLRRWVDGGQVRLSRTAGGHRRIPLQEAIRFIRQTGATVVRPELLGLDDLPGQAEHRERASREQELFEALRAGHPSVARGLIISGYLEGAGVAALCDGPLRVAMDRLGELWKHDARGILVEHRATEICIAALAELRTLLPTVESDAPLALGGAPEQDPYRIPSMMAAATLAECRYRSVNFGAHTPLALLGGEAVERGARLVWVSISVAEEPAAIGREIESLARELSKRQIELVVGGRHHARCLPRGQANVSAIGTMSELAAFARGLVSRLAGPAG